MEHVQWNNIITVCSFLIIGLFYSSCHPKVDSRVEDNKSITYDSMVLFYDDFDINQRCFDCSFYVEIYSTIFDTTIFNDIKVGKIEFYFKNNEQIIKLRTHTIRKDRNKFIVSFLIQQNDLNSSCGYYEDLQTLYDMIKKENLFMHTDSLNYNYSIQEIEQSDDFKIVLNTKFRAKIK